MMDATAQLSPDDPEKMETEDIAAQLLSEGRDSAVMEPKASSSASQAPISTSGGEGTSKGMTDDKQLGASHEGDGDTANKAKEDKTHNSNEEALEEKMVVGKEPQPESNIGQMSPRGASQQKEESSKAANSSKNEEDSSARPSEKCGSVQKSKRHTYQEAGHHGKLKPKEPKKRKYAA